MNFPDVYLFGRAGSGKDTQADILIEDFRYKKMALADPIYQAVGLLTNQSVEEVRLAKKDYRDFLIGLGEGARNPHNAWLGWWFIPRKVRHAHFIEFLKTFGHPIEPTSHKALADQLHGWGDPFYRVKALSARVEAHRRISKHPLVISDVRRPPEVTALTKWGFQGIKLDVSMATCKRRLWMRDGTTNFDFLLHETEQDFEKFPYNYMVDGEPSIEEVSIAIKDCLIESEMISSLYHKLKSRYDRNSL